MRESAIEKYLVEQVAKAGGVAEKFKSPNRKNVPDRLCLWPFGESDFVEVKRPGEDAKPAQKRDHERRGKLGHEVWVVNSKAQVDQYITFWRNILHYLRTE
jgi:hypothetical protein